MSGKTVVYRNEANLVDFKNRLNISKHVLKPIVNEISRIFSNICTNKIKTKNKHRIERIKFTFNTDKRIYTQTKTSKQG
ncbi:hypothetical protein K4S25_11295 [Staphylococcus epidermidis]|nr:hypothetical protein [Staphylococcus epidermidis]